MSENGYRFSGLPRRAGVLIQDAFGGVHEVSRGLIKDLVRNGASYEAKDEFLDLARSTFLTASRKREGSREYVCIEATPSHAETLTKVIFLMPKDWNELIERFTPFEHLTSRKHRL